MTAKKRRSPVVVTVRHDRGNGLASVAPLAGLTRPEADEPTGEPESYDPGEHNVDDVKAHVDANPDQREAVLTAERDGKNRSTLIEWLESETDES